MNGIFFLYFFGHLYATLCSSYHLCTPQIESNLRKNSISSQFYWPEEKKMAPLVSLV